MVTNLEPSYFTWMRVGLGVLAALVFGGIWISQPDVGLEAARNVTLQAGHGLYFEATSEGKVVYTKGSCLVDSQSMCSRLGQFVK